MKGFSEECISLESKKEREEEREEETIVHFHYKCRFAQYKEHLWSSRTNSH